MSVLTVTLHICVGMSLFEKETERSNKRRKSESLLAS